MNDEPITRSTARSFIQKAFDVVYQDDEGDGEVDAGEVANAIESMFSARDVERMLDIAGAKSVGEIVLMYLDGRAETKI